MRIKSIRLIQVPSQWVYDITVQNDEQAQNFKIDGEVFLKNCGTCHSSVQATGSRTVIYNGLSLARIGDSIACGSSNATGSHNHIAGG